MLTNNMRTSMGNSLLRLSSQTLGSIVCRPYWAIHSQRKRRDRYDFICHAVTDSDSSRFEVVELLLTTDAVVPVDTKDGH